MSGDENNHDKHFISKFGYGPEDHENEHTMVQHWLRRPLQGHLVFAFESLIFVKYLA